MTTLMNAGDKKLMMSTLKSLELRVLEEIEDDRPLAEIVTKICEEFVRFRAIHSFSIVESTPERIRIKIKFQILDIPGTVWSTEFMRPKGNNTDEHKK